MGIGSLWFSLTAQFSFSSSTVHANRPTNPELLMPVAVPSHKSLCVWPAQRVSQSVSQSVGPSLEAKVGR